MSNFMVVAIVNGFNDLDEYFPGIILREIAKILQVVEQLSPLAQAKSFQVVLCYKEKVALIFEGLVESNARGMVDVFEDLDLVDEQFWLLDVPFGNLFDSSPLTFDSFFSCFVDHSVCSFTQFLSMFSYLL